MRLLSCCSIFLVVLAASCSNCGPTETTCQSDSDCAVDERCDSEQQRCVILTPAADAGPVDAATTDGTAGDAHVADAPRPDTGPIYRANAGSDQQVALGALVQLSAGATVLPPGASDVVYHWAFAAQPAGSTATIDHFDAANATFVATDPHADYRIGLAITARGVTLQPDEVAVTVLNTPPHANAGADLAISVGAAISLDGNASSDDDGDTLTFAWSILAPDNGATLTSAHTATPVFTPASAFVGSTSIQLAVDDGHGANDTDSVVVATENLPPSIVAPDRYSVAHSCTDQGAGNISCAASVGIVAQVSDPEGENFSVAWSVISCPDGAANAGVCLSGVAPTFTPNSSATPVFAVERDPRQGPVVGTYVVEIVAIDASDRLARHSISITIENRDPTGPAQSLTTAHEYGGGIYHCNLTFALNVTDPDGDWLTASYEVTPSASVVESGGLTATLDAQSEVLTSALLGPYVVTATVDDHQGASTIVTTTIQCTNSAPSVTVSGATSIAHQYTTVYQAPISLTASPSDPENEPSECSWTVVNPVASVDYGSLPATGLTVARSISSIAGQVVATHRFSVACSDGLASATRNVDVTVTNSPPLVEAGDSVTTNGHTYIGGTTPYEAVVSLSARALAATVTDPNNDPITSSWVVVNPASGVTYNIPTGSLNPTLTIRGAAPAIASHTLRLGATDALGLAATDTIAVNVTNRAPTFTSGPALTSTQVTESTSCEYQGTRPTANSDCGVLAAVKGVAHVTYQTGYSMSASDPDGDPLSANLSATRLDNVLSLAAGGTTATYAGNGSVSATNTVTITSQVICLPCDVGCTSPQETFVFSHDWRTDEFRERVIVTTHLVDVIGAAPADSVATFSIVPSTPHHFCN